MPVALKVSIRKGAQLAQEAALMLQSESKEFIVQCIADGLLPCGGECLVMELALTTAAHLAASRRGLSQQEALPLVRQVLAGLTTLHTHLHHAHLNLRGPNVLLLKDASGQVQVKVSDFGLAVDFLTARRAGGTPNYTSPEVVAGQLFGSRADTWSAGCLCLELRIGQSAFWYLYDQGISTNEVVLRCTKKARHELYAPPYSLLLDAAELSAISRCFQEADARPTCAELLSEGFFATPAAAVAVAQTAAAKVDGTPASAVTQAVTQAPAALQK